MNNIFYYLLPISFKMRYQIKHDEKIQAILENIEKKAQAGLKAGEAAADTTANSYKNVYNDVYNNTYQNTYDGLRGDKLNQNANAVNAQAGLLGISQQEDQNEYNRAWGNLGGWGSFATGLLTSDERLKRFKDISFDEEKDDLKVYYKKEKK